ncbi:hypothetical protein [Gemmobacter aquatilis]|uniref:hypothetical protein n=1 Tax=Gemmobacter aquatilis TaxID=933059 RepID=UPI001114466C|nr:hypothetical protein [Gemmobacter aquatilis]
MMLSGILSGLVATVSALLSGFPIWLSLLLYPMGGMVGVALLLLVALKTQAPRAEYSASLDGQADLQRIA